MSEKQQVPSAGPDFVTKLPTELEARHEQGGEGHGSEVPLRETARLQGAS